MKNIAVIIGSPRRNGNTEALAASFITGAEAAGNTVDVIRAAKLDLHGCIGCNACSKSDSHRCVFSDDMAECYERLARAEVLVFATPIYFYNISSQLKCLVDRLHNPVRNGFKVKKLALLAVCADNDEAVFDSVLTMYRSTLSYFGLEDGGVVTVSGVGDPGAISGNSLLKKAEELGRGI